MSTHSLYQEDYYCPMCHQERPCPCEREHHDPQFPVDYLTAEQKVLDHWKRHAEEAVNLATTCSGCNEPLNRCTCDELNAAKLQVGDYVLTTANTIVCLVSWQPNLWQGCFEGADGTPVSIHVSEIVSHAPVTRV